MIKKIKNFLYSRSFAPKLNYPLYFVLDDAWVKYPILSRIMRNIGYHSYTFRKKYFSQSVNERIVEIPKVLQWIEKKNAGILDVGCDESILTLHMASLGHNVTALDLNKYEYTHPNLRFVQGDICNINLPGKAFDYIIFLSVLEHVGLGVYGEARNTACSDIVAVRRARDFMKDDGRMIISVPYGKKAEGATQRVYDKSAIEEIIDGFEIEKSVYYKGLGQKFWTEVPVSDLANVDSINFTQGVAIYCLKKKYS